MSKKQPLIPRTKIIAILVIIYLTGLCSVVNANVFRLGIPNDTVSPTFKKTFDALARKGLSSNTNLQIVKIDLSRHQTEAELEAIRNDIANNCDLFFLTGAHLSIIFKANIQTPVFFIATSNPKSKVPSSMQENTTGFYWEPTSAIFKRSAMMLPDEMQNKLGFIYNNETMAQDQVKKYKNSAAQADITLSIKNYNETNELEKIILEFVNEKVGAIILFPPSLRKTDLPIIIDLQNKYKIPLLGQVKEHIELGLLGGPAIDDDIFIPEVASYIEKISKGRLPSHLPIKHFNRKFILNLSTVSLLNIKIPQDIIEQSTIVGKRHYDNNDNKLTGKLVDGNYTIGFPKNMSNSTQKEVLSHLAMNGYIEEKNLTIKRIDIIDKLKTLSMDDILKEIASDTDLFIVHGNVLQQFFTENGPYSPVVFVATKETADSIPQRLKNKFNGVVRASKKSIFLKARSIIPGKGKIGMLANEGSTTKQMVESHKKIAAQIGIDIDFRFFKSKDEIEGLMKDMQKTSDFILLFPPFANGDNLLEIIRWQNTLRFPVLGQTKGQIEQGLLGGPSLDTSKMLPQLAQVIIKTLQGKNLKNVPFFYFSEKIIINLKTVSTLDINLPPDITAQAEILR